MSEEKKVFIVGFSHLDLFWAGTRAECLSRGNRVINTALMLLEKYPEYRFMLESTNFIEFFLDCFPEKKELMIKLAKSGRLEIIPMRSIIYSHLPAAETTVRNIFYGSRYCMEELNIRPDVISLSDIPGATAQLPQIARQLGMEAIILSRGFTHHTNFVEWTSLDGTRIQAYCPDSYATVAMCLSNEDYQIMTEKESELVEYVEVDYPQIKHWGTDLYILSEQILENIYRWNSEGKKLITFSTFREFLSNTPPAEVKKLQGEAPSSWPNIESSWPDIWPLDIPAEDAMFKAEYFASLSSLSGRENAYPYCQMRQAWDKLLDAMDHNQNGIGGYRSDLDKLELKESARLIASSLINKYAWRLASQTHVPHDGAFPIVVFNSLSWKRSEVVTSRVACYGRTFSTCFNGYVISSRYYKDNKVAAFRLVDEKGVEIPFWIEEHLMMLTDTMEISFFAEDIPAFGCKCFFLEVASPKEFPNPFVLALDSEKDKENPCRYLGDEVIENEFFRFDICRLSGEISVYDKISDRQLLNRASVIGLEEKRGEYVFKMALSGRTFPFAVDRIEIIDCNPVYCLVEIDGLVYGQRILQKLKIWANKPIFELENTIHWEGSKYVRLEQTFPFASEQDAKIRYGVPFGQVQYPETIYNKTGKAEEPTESNPTANIRLVRDWINISDNVGGLRIGADHRMWTFRGNTPSNCMLRGIGWTSGGVHIDENGERRGVHRPPEGEYVFRFRVCADNGYRAMNGLVGWELNAPLHSVTVASGMVGDTPGLILPALPDTSETSVIISNLKPGEDGLSIVLRCFEGSGRESELELPVHCGYRWLQSDIREQEQLPLAELKIRFRPFEIKTLMLAKVMN